MDDDPRKIAETIRISTHTSHVLWQNISILLGVKAVFLALALAGTASLWVAVLADMGASLVVIANGLRLPRRPAHRTRAPGPLQQRSVRCSDHDLKTCQSGCPSVCGLSLIAASGRADAGRSTSAASPARSCSGIGQHPVNAISPGGGLASR